MKWLGCDEIGPDGKWLPSASTVLGIFNDGWVRPGLHWVIVGGESGVRARPMDVAWARSLVQQCRSAGVAVFVKQLGWRPYQRTSDDLGPQVELMEPRDRKGGDMAEWPEDLRVREFPR